MKPHYRLRVFDFEGKYLIWWAERVHPYFRFVCSTAAYRDPRNAIAEAATL
jgi:hypothetical protein